MIGRDLKVIRIKLVGDQRGAVKKMAATPRNSIPNIPKLGGQKSVNSGGG